VRATSRDEGLGLDVTQHGEEAYSRGEGAILVLPDAGPSRGLPVVAPVRLETEAGAG
jgi:Amt family ammonium transporter